MRLSGTLVLLGGLSCLSMQACAHVPIEPLPAAIAVPRNKRYDKSPLQERRHGLPSGTLTSECSLIVLDQSRLCFDVILRVLAERKDLADLRSWRIFLEGEPDFHHEAPEVFPAGEPQWEGFTGYRTVYNSIERQSCNPHGRCWTRSTTYPVGTVEETDDTVALSGTICFPNQGIVNTATTAFKLVLEDPLAGVLARQHASFKWKLQGGMLDPSPP